MLQPTAKTIIIIFFTILIFTTFESYKASDFSVYLLDLFQTRRFLLSVFGYVFLILVVFLFKVNKLDFSKAKRLRKFIFYFAIICSVLKMINPYNHTRFSFAGISPNPDFSEYLLLLYLFLLISINDKAFSTLVKFFFKFFLIIGIIRGLLLLFFWFNGQGDRGYYGFNSTTTESDTLYLFSFLQVLTLALGLIQKKNKYYLLSSLFLFIQIYSYRRSSLLICVIASLLIILIYYAYYMSLLKKVTVFFFICLLIYFLTSSTIISSLSNEPIFKRYLSALPGQSGETSEFSDSGHWEQTAITTRTMYNEMPFWGVGFGKLTNVEGQYETGIHNVYIAAWAQYGVYQALFYVFCFLIFIYFFIFNFFIVKVRYKNENFFNSVVTAWLLIFFISLSVSSLPFIEHLKMGVVWYTSLIFIIRNQKYELSIF